MKNNGHHCYEGGTSKSKVSFSLVWLCSLRSETQNEKGLVNVYYNHGLLARKIAKTASEYTQQMKFVKCIWKHTEPKRDRQHSFIHW